MKRLNLTVLTVFVLIVSLLISTIDCSASEAYFTDLIEAELATQEVVDMYNYYLSSGTVKAKLDEINNYKYVIVSCSVNSASSHLSFFCFDDDVVMYKYFAEMKVLGVISKSEVIPYKYFSFQTNNSTLNPDGSLKVIANSSFEEEYSTRHVKDDVTYCKSEHYYGVCSVGKLVRCDVPVYQDVDDAVLALEGNDVIPLYEGSAEPKDYSSELYFKSFDVIPHVSNSAEYYYFDIKYELSDYAKRNIDKLNLNFENCYRWEASSDLEPLVECRNTGWRSNSISLKEYPFGFKITISNLGCYQVAVNQWGMKPECFVGNSVMMNIVDTLLGGWLPGIDIIEISEAYLYFKFNLRFYSSNGVVSGKRNDFTYDILNKKIEKSIYVPNTTTNSDGSTTFVKDDNGNITYTQEGDKISSNDYYYNNVTDDGNKYFYYDKDGNGNEITEDVYTNSSASASIGDINISIGDGSGEYISISPVDYNQFVEAVVAALKEFDTKGGVFKLLQGAFSLFPDRVNKIMSGAIAAVVLVSLFCILRRR